MFEYVRLGQFFTFITIGDGKPIYFNLEQRLNRSKFDIVRYNFDSPNNIAQYFLGTVAEDFEDFEDCDDNYKPINAYTCRYEKFNHYFYGHGDWCANNDSKQVENWFNKFKHSDEFQSLCLHYLKTIPDLLCYIDNQTESMCFEALRCDSKVFKYVKNKTKSLCTYATIKHGTNLEFVPEKYKTSELCSMAVCNMGSAIRYAHTQPIELCKLAISKYPMALYDILKPTQELIDLAIFLDPIIKNDLEMFLNRKV